MYASYADITEATRFVYDGDRNNAAVYRIVADEALPDTYNIVSDSGRILWHTGLSWAGARQEIANKFNNTPKFLKVKMAPA